MTPAVLFDLVRVLLPLTGGLWFEGGGPCAVTVVQSGDVCVAHVVGTCEMPLARCKDSVVYVGESEEPAAALACSKEPLPRAITIDCSEVPRP